MDNPNAVDKEDRGPIVPRDYKMNKDDRMADGEMFWRLEPDPPIPAWKFWLGLERAGFEFHPGEASDGCIITDKDNPAAMAQHKAVHGLLNMENGSNRLRVVR